MGKKRKSVASRLDEVDRTMYSTFSTAASSLSQVYTQAMNQQKLSFQAGERHGLEKVYQWILRKYEEGHNLTPADIVAYLQNEIDCGGEEITTSPRTQLQQHSHPTGNSPNPGTLNTSLLFGAQTTGGHGPRSGHSDQTKNSIFSNALSSPVRRTLQHCELSQGGGCGESNTAPVGNAARNSGANSPSLDTSSPCFNDTSMDMHSDSPNWLWKS